MVRGVASLPHGLGKEVRVLVLTSPDKEADAKAAGLAESASDTDVFAAMAENPKLIQRPIGVNGGKAVLGRPNAKLLDIV
jgi:arsenate reductase-like glutaredoxin family protein